MKLEEAHTGWGRVRVVLHGASARVIFRVLIPNRKLLLVSSFRALFCHPVAGEALIFVTVSM